ncbi:hypothetical protein G9A89_019659 [Geosiphon pyriformis]|nr:hypothetical protein G9A89_019659 [Geosiphon pyriformis]
MASSQLTPLQAHYLKKELITRQIQKELAILRKPNSLSNLGLLSLSKPNLLSEEEKNNFSESLSSTETPFLKFIFSRFVTTFPFLSNTQQEFWKKVQEFLHEFHAKNISGTSSREETTKRRQMTVRIVTNLTLLLNAALKTTAGKDESIIVDFDHENEQIEDQIKEPKTFQNLVVNGWEFNIVTVKTIVEKRHLRDNIHVAYVIHTRQQNSDKIIAIMRRHKQFRALATKLKEEFPDLDIPSVPNKINDRKLSLFCEKNRLNLRAYLRALLSIPAVSKNKHVKAFLTQNPVELTAEEQKDIEKRLKLDELRMERQSYFNVEAAKMAKELEEQVEAFKKGLLEQGGLSKLAETMKETSQISELPISYQKLIEWGEISFASTLYHLFIGSDNSTDTFTQLKRIHGLMPYKTLRGILKISNPMALMKAFLNLFLAQPFGSTSLVQRMLSVNFNEEIKELQKEIIELKTKINEEKVCQKIRNFVYAAEDIQQVIRKEADDEGIRTLVRAILHTDALEPQLQAEYITTILESLKVDKGCRRNNLDILKKLYLLYVRQRDKEMMIEVVFQGVTGNLLKDIITIFYEPLARIYKAANIGDSLPDLSNFVDDLIKVVEEAEKKELMEIDPVQSIVQTFISLVHRHMQPFYAFVHSIYSHDSTSLFASILDWMQNIIDFLRKGPNEKLNLDNLVNQHLKTEDAHTQLFTDLERLMEWHTLRKKRHLDYLKNFMGGQDSTIDDSNSAIMKIMNKELESMSEVPENFEEVTLTNDEDFEDEKGVEDTIKLNADDSDSSSIRSSSSSSFDGNSGTHTRMVNYSHGKLKMPPVPELQVLPCLQEPFVQIVQTQLFWEGPVA